MPWTRLWTLLLTIAGALVMAPWLAGPFSGLELNVASYFGVFSRNWDHLGFGATKGMPLLATLVDDPMLGIPYMNHPPGTAWLLWFGGSAEWQMRLTSMIATLLGAMSLFVILRGRLGFGIAFLAGCIHLTMPVVNVFGQMTYATFVMPTGLVMLAAFVHLRDAERPRRVAAWTVIGLCGFVGTFLDWSFACWCLAVIPFAWSGRDVVRTLRRGLVPAAGAGIAVACVFAWKAWLDADPNLPGLPELSAADTLSASILENRPPFSKHMAACGTSLLEGMTWPVVIGVLGAYWLLRRDRRLFFALLLAGALWPMLYANHVTMLHRMFFAHIAPLFAASAAAFALRLGGTWMPPFPRIVLVVAMLLGPWTETVTLRVRSDTGFFRDLGRVMSEEAVIAVDSGTKYYTTGNAFGAFGYYLDTRHAIPTTIRGVEYLTAGIAVLAEDVGAKYVWIDLEGDPWTPLQFVPPGLMEYLDPFPRRRVPELEVEFDLDGPRREHVRVKEAWVYTLKEAGVVREE